NIALPSAQKALHFSNANRQWIVTAYALAFGSLLLVGGRIGDLLGRKRLFIAGAFGFAVASAVGGAAQSFDVLVAARALQGMFAAVMAPAALSLVSTTFTDARERGIAFGIWGGIGGGAGAIGLLLGGVLTQSISWRWTLFVNLALAIPAAIGATALLRSDARSAGTRIDVPGTVTATGGLFALVYGFAHAETHGWGSSSTVAFLVAGALLLAAFAAIQTRAAHPLLPPRVVLDRNRGGSFVILGLLGVGIFAAFLFLTYYLQQTKGYSPSRTGIAYLPLTAVLVISAGVANARLLPRTGPR
ncbi:MAG TPA: MFS transporter, partial [Solirubrobacteraceae bacterium]